ncbi:MAG: DNA mismatch repair endonuclease MutL [Candidatus Marinimicrobia bacterium]|nr:DNA mismatch repair endonuclease MutL [Candidatus Neomarinimicrobiota bacterium]MCF7827533.1 DNA mismatch repair endonuclease MutL [Candidatus Neomarinimicrobiota bacterium]MCF7881605.1 DNA mismatch repair endonuclease MutL [Candidatus Neomarinimicrobiota bacterium]
MSSIQVLSDSIANKIAAGEVVQRPASALKELVENSIDSGAENITVHVEEGGKKLIQVIDDGQGMDRDDLVLAFERHATSKIREESDLEAINTLGFRGEALASIAAVARVEAKSQTPDAEVGHEIKIHGGEIQDVTPTAMNRGTQIAVKDLFFNTPARRKFLKGKRTEFRHISETMKRFALGYPDIRFELYHNDRENLSLPPASLKERIGSIFGKGYPKNIIEIDEEYRGIGIFGYIGNLDMVRKSRGEQYLFLNHRYISDSLMSSAIYKGYRHLIQRGEYPFFVLNLQLDPKEFDVNVHPAKMEVKFKDQWQLFNYLRNVVERSFQDVLHMAGQFQRGVDDDEDDGKDTAPQQDWTDTIRPLEDPKYSPQSPAPERPQSPQYKAPEPSQMQRPESSEGARTGLVERVNRFARREQPREEDIAEQVWQVHKLYIMSQIKSGLVILDQHAAHERILFEEAMESFEKQNISSQQLLFPQVIEFSADDFDLMLELLPHLEKIGFEMKEFGKNTVVLNATPSDMRGGDEAKLIREIIDEYKERRDKDNPTHYKLAASYSCKAAIKAGDVLTEEEMRTLIHRLFQCEHPYHCPHGRPVIVNLSLKELHKRFERPT